MPTPMARYRSHSGPTMGTLSHPPEGNLSSDDERRERPDPVRRDRPRRQGLDLDPDRPCPECGFEASAVGPELVPGSIAVLTRPWAKVLARADVRDRPAPGVWSALEYACHVRDVCALFAERTRLMLTEQSPRFANWDQDATAIEKSYRRADPDVVAGELAAAAQATSSRMPVCRVSSGIAPACAATARSSPS